MHRVAINLGDSLLIYDHYHPAGQSQLHCVHIALCAYSCSFLQILSPLMLRWAATGMHSSFCAVCCMADTVVVMTACFELQLCCVSMRIKL